MRAAKIIALRIFILNALQMLLSVCLSVCLMMSIDGLLRYAMNAYSFFVSIWLFYKNIFHFSNPAVCRSVCRCYKGLLCMHSTPLIMPKGFICYGRLFCFFFFAYFVVILSINFNCWSNILWWNLWKFSDIISVVN